MVTPPNGVKHRRRGAQVVVLHLLEGNLHGVAKCKGGGVAQAARYMRRPDASPQGEDDPVVLQRDAVVSVVLATLGPAGDGRGQTDRDYAFLEPGVQVSVCLFLGRASGFRQRG